MSREEEICATQVMENYHHPNGDLMSLLQVVELAETTLKDHNVTAIRLLPKNQYAHARTGKRLSAAPQCDAGYAEHQTDHGEHQGSELPCGMRRRPTDKYYATLLTHTLWEVPHAGNVAWLHRKVREPDLWSRVGTDQDNIALFAIDFVATPEVHH